ncbi:MAG: hypothetical protein PHE83_01155 [Opitutaceae bacterium]|nr:hypothetical protein [Opitutaceae bacterium]
MNARCFALCAALIAGAGITPLFADDPFSSVPTLSIAEAKKSGLFVEGLSIEPNWVIYEGKRIEFVEAWIEHSSQLRNLLILFSRRVRLRGYWVCIRIKSETNIFHDNLPFPRLNCEGGRIGGTVGVRDFGDGDPVAFGRYDTPLPEYRFRTIRMPGEGYEPLVVLKRTGSNTAIEKTAEQSGPSGPERE